MREKIGYLTNGVRILMCRFSFTFFIFQNETLNHGLFSISDRQQSYVCVRFYFVVHRNGEAYMQIVIFIYRKTEE